MSEYEVQSGFQEATKTSKYPFEGMGEDDYFVIPLEGDQKAGTVGSGAVTAGNKWLAKQLDDNGVRQSDLYRFSYATGDGHVKVGIVRKEVKEPAPESKEAESLPPRDEAVEG